VLDEGQEQRVEGEVGEGVDNAPFTDPLQREQQTLLRAP
jgi:hypothetical protein